MTTAPTITTLPTCDLDAGTLSAIQGLLATAFDGDFGPEDLEHSLGGMHALVRIDGELVGHGSVIQRRLVHGGRALRTGYLEAMAVRSDMRRRGLGAALMVALERVIRGSFELGALGATDDGAHLYSARGWLPWRGPLFAMTTTGVVETPDERGGIYVLPVSATLDLDGALTCDYRDGDAW